MLSAPALLPHPPAGAGMLATRRPRTGIRGGEATTPGTGAHEAAATRILVVEDDWFAGMDMEAALHDAGYDVLELVTSAEEAVAAAASNAPDLIVMDIRLVGSRDGVDAALEIAHRFGIRCLFVTAFVDPALKSRAEPARPFGWLTKPISGESLVAAIKDALGRS